MKSRTIGIAILSIVCYFLILEWFVIALLFLGIATITVDRIKSPLARKISTFLVVTLYVLGFVVLKSSLVSKLILGYSVFAFSGISYIVEQNKNKQKYSVFEGIAFLFFFPKMLAGPIVKPNQLIPQLSASYKWKVSMLFQGLKLVVYGAFLKLILGDILINIQGLQLGINALMETLIWAVRFYIDFYAYSIIAVGISNLLGIELPYNFNAPYFANSFKSFWRRWNITLSFWLRDYVYIPLGGNRCCKAQSIINILITFVISGLWHGITLPFVLWGIIHGCLVSIEKLLLNHWPSNKLFAIIYRFCAMFVIMTLWELFRCNDFSDIQLYVCRILESSSLNHDTFVIMLLSLLTLFVIDNKHFKEVFLESPISKIKITIEVSLFSIMLATLILCPYKYSFDFFYLNF